MERLSRFYPDPVLLFAVFLLFLIGFLNIVSVRVTPALLEGFDPEALKKPILFLTAFVLGSFLMSFMAFALNYRKLNNQRFIYGAVMLSVVLLVAVLVKKLILGKPIDRWLIGSSVQPSELSKIVLILFVAYYVSRKGYITKLRFLGWAVLVVLVHSVLLMLQPDKGMAIFVLVLSWALLWIGGVSPRVYAPVGVLFGITGFLILAFGGEYIQKRFSAWRDPFGDTFGSGYQVIQSLIAFMQGGFFGQGYGKGLQKLGPLTQADTDYALATLGEELGFPGVFFVMVLYVVVVWRLIRMAREVPDTFGRVIVAGVALNVALSVLVNVLMTVNLLPPKGTPLPFVSYGISNLTANLIGLGLAGAVYKRQIEVRTL
ncbi:MAG: FtsW/RodA/SpoVE family cell cycle protein [Aquificota bacterium]|nr:FtsW/RodA/SpoVE family cell cycle protein [Aquificota bacterium]